MVGYIYTSMTLCICIRYKWMSSIKYTVSPLTQTNTDPMISIHRCIYTHFGPFQISLNIPAESRNRISRTKCFTNLPAFVKLVLMCLEILHIFFGCVSCVRPGDILNHNVTGRNSHLYLHMYHEKLP